MKIRFRNLRPSPVPLPGPLPRLDAKTNDVTIDITPEEYDRYKEEIESLVRKGLIDQEFVQLVGSFPDDFHLDQETGTLNYQGTAIAPPAGNLFGPASAVPDNIASFNGPSGSIVKDSGVPSANVPTANQKDALLGTSGAPSSTNRYVTNDDPRNTNSRTPTGSAGGDLGSTYPNPQVVAITESAGAGTRLSTGSIPDGQFVRRSGTTLIGDSAFGPLSNTNPVNVDKSAAGPGVAIEAARQDHKHDVVTAIPTDIGTVNQEGTSTSLARADHIHSHGNQPGGSLHNHATSLTSGFMSASDKFFFEFLTSGKFVIEVRNESGVTIPENKLVAIVGFSVVEDRYLINLADKDTASRRPAIGVTENDILNNTNGIVVPLGIVEGVDTSAFLITDQLVLGNNGNFSRPPPDEDPFTGEIQLVGSVIKVGATDGAIAINAQQGLLPTTATQIFALAGTDGTPSKLNPYVTDSDSRNTDDRFPLPHASTHLPTSGSDPLTVGVPVTVTKAANDAGAADSFARSDHKHDVSTAVPNNLSAGAVATEGAATSVARSDHAHGVPVAAPVNVTKAANAEGVATTLARSDHKHDVSTAVPVNIGTANQEGVSTSLARADHVHRGTLLQTQFAEQTTDVTTTSTTFTDLLTVNITTTGGDLLIQASAGFKQSNDQQSVYFQVLIDDIVQRGAGATCRNQDIRGSMSIVLKRAVAAGARVVKLQWRVSANTGSVNAATVPEEHASLLVSEVTV